MLFVSLNDSWLSNIAHYLTYGECLDHLSPKEKRNLKLKATKYAIWNDVLYKRGLNDTFMWCVDKKQQQKLLKAFNDEACGGKFSSSLTTFKILRECYYWL